MNCSTGMLFVCTLWIGCVQPSKKISTPNKTDSLVINNTASLATDTAPAPDRFSKQFEQGTDFLASGNEPFWSLEIDFDKTMHFKMEGGLELITPAVEGVKAMDANVIRYHASTEKGTLTVQIQKLECINDMSGEKLEYSVTINTKSNTDKDYTAYKGCGRYLSDYRLHNIWVLDSINNKKILAADFMKGTPIVEFNLTENKIFGHTGCNNINGTIEVMGNKIQISRLATTRLACKDMDFENNYINSLSRKTVPYTIEPGKLRLQVNADSVFTYRKVD